MNQQTAATATQPEASTRTGDVYQSITDQIVASIEAGAQAARYSRRYVRHRFAAAGAATKFRIAKTIAKELPELAPRLPAERKIWLPEHANMSIFDAASLALAHYAAIAQETGSEVKRAA